MKAVVYCRVSTRDQDSPDKDSIGDQITRCKRTIDEHSWNLIDIYKDVQKGHQIDTRESLIKLLQDAKENKFDLVVFRDADRLSRDRATATIIREQLKDQLIQTYSINQPKEPVSPEEYDPDTDDSGVIMESFADIKADLDIKSLRRKVRQGAKNRALRGEPHNVPYGYNKQYTQVNPTIKFDVLVNEEQSGIVQRIFDLYGNKENSYRSITRTLNQEGILSPMGVLWSSGTIQKILQNPFYIGFVRHNHRPVKRKKRVRTSQEDWIIVKNNSIPQLVSDELFSKAQERIKQRSRISGRALASKGLLVGLAKCGYCKGNLYYKKHKRKNGKNNKLWYSYNCSRGEKHGSLACKSSGYLMEAKKLENEVIDFIDSLVKNPKLEKAFISKTNGKQKQEIEKKLKQASKSIEKLVRSESKIWIAYEAGGITLEEFGIRKEELGTEKTKLEEEVIRLNQLSSKLHSTKELQKHKAKFLKEFKQKFDSSRIELRKKMLQGLITEIMVKKNAVDIRFVI
jgi:site-specific DNA recombinase